MAEGGWVKPYYTFQGRPEVKYFLQRENLLAKSSRPLGTLLKRRCVLSPSDHRSCPLHMEGLGMLPLGDWWPQIWTSAYHPLRVSRVSSLSSTGTKLPFIVPQWSIKGSNSLMIVHHCVSEGHTICAFYYLYTLIVSISETLLDGVSLMSFQDVNMLL